MQTLSALNLKGSSFIFARIFTFLMLLLPTFVLAQQVPAKEKQEGEKMGQATLKEAKVTARVLTSVEEVGPMKVRLNILNPTGKQVRLSILNFANQPVYQDAFQAREYNKVLDFNATEPGRYSLHVKGPQQPEETRRFAISSEEARTLTASELERQKTTDVIATIYKIAPTKNILCLFYCLY